MAEVIEGDFGSIGGNYFGQYELVDRDDYSTATPYLEAVAKSVMLSVSNDVIFLGDFAVPSSSAIKKSYLFREVLPEECCPKKTIYLPVFTAVDSFEMAVIKIESSGKMMMIDAGPVSPSKVKSVGVAYTNGISFNISDKYYA